MAIDILGVPQIQDIIAESLTTQELLDCVVVCKRWNSIFIPLLWREIHTSKENLGCYFRCYELGWYHDFFKSPKSQKTLLCNSRHIRSLHVRNNNVLKLLKKSAPTNLHELHYMIDTNVSGNQGLDTLMNLMKVSPRLRALTVEKAILDEPYLDEFKGLLKLLCQHCPAVTSVDFTFDEARSQFMIAYILIELLKTKQNVALSISMWRDPSWVPSRNICLEVRKMIDSIAEETLEVKKLELSCSSLEDFTSDFSLLLAKCKKLERLRLECSDYATSEWLCRVMEESCPNLQHLNIVSPTFLDEDWASIVRSCRRLVTFKSNSCIEPLVVKALHKHSTTLEHIYLTGGNLGEGNLPLLSSCSKLKTFSCPYFVILPSAIIDMPEWTCLGLQTLSLNVRFDDRALHPNHTDEKESAQWIISTSQARHRLCEQIGKLSQLRKLEIRNRDWTMNTFDTNQAQEIKPIVALTPSGHDVSFIGLGNGLEMLANLKNLVDFVVEVGFEYFPRKNIEWMIEHWPKLRILHQFGMDVPSSAKEDPSFKEASKLYNGGDDYSGDLDWIKELRKQRPSLEFVVWGDGGRMWPPYKDTPACPTCTRS